VPRPYDAGEAAEKNPGQLDGALHVGSRTPRQGQLAQVRGTEAQNAHPGGRGGGHEGGKAGEAGGRGYGGEGGEEGREGRRGEVATGGEVGELQPAAVRGGS
jgi:hypothetical protein